MALLLFCMSLTNNRTMRKNNAIVVQRASSNHQKQQSCSQHYIDDYHCRRRPICVCRTNKVNLDNPISSSVDDAMKPADYNSASVWLQPRLPALRTDHQMSTEISRTTDHHTPMILTTTQVLGVSKNYYFWRFSGNSIFSSYSSRKVQFKIACCKGFQGSYGF